MIYLASAYTNFSRAVMQENYEKTVEATALLLATGYRVYSPIVHCHPVAAAFALPHTFDFWLNYNHDFIDRAAAVWVLCDIDFSASKGVNEEIEYCRKIHKPLLYVRTVYGTIEFSQSPLPPKF